MYEQEQYPTMGEREKCLFALQGFLLVRNFLSATEVKALNESLDANLDKRGEFGEPNVISGQWQGRPLEGQFSKASDGRILLERRDYTTMPVALGANPPVVGQAEFESEDALDEKVREIVPDNFRHLDH